MIGPPPTLIGPPPTTSGPPPTSDSTIPGRRYYSHHYLSYIVPDLPDKSAPLKYLQIEFLFLQKKNHLHSTDHFCQHYKSASDHWSFGLRPHPKSPITGSALWSL